MRVNPDALEANYAREESAFMRRFTDFRTSSFIAGEYEGERAPLVMAIGEAPGAQEDVKGRPFCGQAGIILRMMMAHAGLNTGTPRVAGNTWLTNVVKLRPPGNRTPKPEEIELAKPFLRQEWEAIGRPRVIVCLGNTPLIAVTGWGSVSKRAGNCETYTNSYGDTMFVYPMFHPSNAVRRPAMQPIVEKHWGEFQDWWAGYLAVMGEVK